MPDNDDLLTIEQRKEIFKALIEAQDQSMSVRKSRQHVCQQFNVTERQVLEIEEEGMEHQWPPFEE